MDKDNFIFWMCHNEHHSVYFLII